MPQIAQILETYASQIFWLLIVFGLIYFGIARTMLPKIEATVDARERKIAGDLAAAEQARAAAGSTEEAWRKQTDEARAAAQAAIVQAKARAAADIGNLVAKADAKIAETTAAAEAELAVARASALASVEAVATDAARDLIAKLSGASVTAAATTKAVKEALAHG